MTFLQQITALRRDCLQSFDIFSLCQKESADISADVVPTQHVMSSGMVRTTEFDEMSGCIPDIFTTHRHVSG